MRSMPERGIHYVMANGDGYIKMKRTGYQSPLSCMANRKWLSSPLDHDGIWRWRALSGDKSGRISRQARGRGFPSRPRSPSAVPSHTEMEGGGLP